MKKFLIIDGSSIFYRAFYAMPNLTAPSGEPTGAVFGFANIILKILREYSPDLAAVALDTAKKTFRNEIYNEYKANREQMPADLAAQLPLLKEFIEVLGIKAVGAANYEADDVIGTLAAQAKDFFADILTGDRDALQLINERTRVLLNKKATVALYDEQIFRTEYGFAPARLTDFKGLCGDSSDNIPGVKGIGEKTAKELLKQFDSLEEIFVRRAEIKSARIRNALDQSEAVALMSKKLATIVRDVPGVAFNETDYRITPDLSRAEEFCDRLALSRVKKSLRNLFAAEDLFAPIGNKDEVIKTPDGQIILRDLKSYLRENEMPTERVIDLELVSYLLNPERPKKMRDEELNGTDLKAAAEYERRLTPELRRLYWELELPLTKVLAAMERRGVYVDKGGLMTKSAEMAKRIAALEQNIYDAAGESFNLNSPKQLAEVLFDKLKIPARKKTKTGRSTAAEVLAQIENPIAAQILKYRELMKLKTTYLDGLAKLIGADGRIHTQYNQAITATGRLSSSEPNLQNIPVRTAAGKAIRSLFIPGKGYDLIMTADYSQIELRILAHMSGEPNLIAAFAAGEDIHSKTAQELGISRAAAKAVNFGIIYGLSDYGLAQELKISRQAAADFISRYFDKNPAVKSYLNETVKAAQSKGCVTTLYGRRRQIEGLKAAKRTDREAAERIAMNTPIQGTAADIMKRAMLRAEDALRGMTSRIIMQVHDELVLEVTAAEAATVAEKIREAMEGAAQLTVPLPVKINVGKSW